MTIQQKMQLVDRIRAISDKAGQGSPFIEFLATSHFRPYRRVAVPTFALHLFDLNIKDGLGKHQLGYLLEQKTPGKRRQDVIFEGVDFGASPLHAIDSRETALALMSFLTLRVGDTDEEYFFSYSDRQIEFREHQAEILGCLVAGEEEASRG